MQPRRIQRKRTAGWKKPENTICIGRGRHGLWGNPWFIENGGMYMIHRPNGAGRVIIPEQAIMSKTQEDTVKRYRAWLRAEMHNWCYQSIRPVEQWREAILNALPTLRGKNIACWCPEGSPCHGDVLIELANQPKEFVRGILAAGSPGATGNAFFQVGDGIKPTGKDEQLLRDGEDERKG